MSVGIDLTLKFDIVELFQENGNKTETAKAFNISPRTVGRIMQEYNWAMANAPYDGLYGIFNMLVMPDNIIIECLYDEESLHIFNGICIPLYDTRSYKTASEFIHDVDVDTFKVVFDRMADNKDVGDSPSDEFKELLDKEIKDSMDESIIEQVTSNDCLSDDDDYDYDDYNDDELENPDQVDAVNDFNWNLIATAKSITVTRTSRATGETESVEIAKGNEQFRLAWGVIREIDMSDDDQVNIGADEIYSMNDPKTAIEKFCQGKLTVDVKTETIYYDGNVVHNSLGNRIIHMVTTRGIEGGQALINFLEKLMENPSYRAVNSLYDFLVHNDIEINSDGNFYAWKRVSDDYTDCHTGTFDNSVGAEPSMPRNMVNEDPKQTCSAGLHVAAEHYLSHFRGYITIKCEVHPKDVVSCPIDYSFAKLRTCRYKVVEDVTGKFNY